MGKSNTNNHQKQKSLIVNKTLFSATYEGPLPPPSYLKEYETIVPGSAKMIIKMAVDQKNHRQELEKSVVQNNIKREVQGMWLSFIVAMTIMITGVILIFNNKNIPAGLITLFIPFFTQGASFFYKKKEEKIELEKRKQEIKENRTI